MQIHPVDDPLDERLDAYRHVRDSEWVNRRGVFLVEGRTILARLLGEPRFRLLSLVVTRTALDRVEREIPDFPEAVPVFLVPPAALRATSGVSFHQGCVAVAEEVERPSLERLVSRLQSGAECVVALENVGNPDNMGSVFRNARAFGARAVILSPGCCPPLYRKAIRTSMGAVLHVPFAVAEDWPRDLDALKRRGFDILALTPHPDAAALAHVDVGRSIVFLLGHEGYGLTDAALAMADTLVRIEMAEGADSVNVAAASAVALHHVFAARRTAAG